MHGTVDDGGHYVDDQSWPLNEYDDEGALILTPEPVDSRFLVSARVGVRPVPGDERLEVAITGWNLLAGDEGYPEPARTD